MYGSPSVIITAPEPCRRILFDDERFCPGWPKSTQELIGKYSFVGIFDEQHRYLRRLTAAPVTGHEALSLYIPYIEQNVKRALDRWSKMGEIEFLTEIRKLTFKIIMYIFLSSESEQVVDVLEKEYTHLNHGLRAMAINIPGFVYHRARKVILIELLTRLEYCLPLRSFYFRFCYEYSVTHPKVFRLFFLTGQSESCYDIAISSR